LLPCASPPCRREPAICWPHEQQDEVGPLLQLGEALRRAHRELDGDQLWQLNRQQRELVYALSQQAKQLAAEAEQPLSDQAVQEVEETLHTAFADPRPGEAFAEGRPTKPLAATVDLTGQATPGRPPVRHARGHDDVHTAAQGQQGRHHDR
jgi:hypothetical protein